jgi:hypothetical protein
MTDFPLRHFSARVPWHDSGWIGSFCNAPKLNGACAKLKRIAGSKNDDKEFANAGESLENIARDEWPPCVDERATFMAPFEMDHLKRHALATTNSKHYGHFQPTPQRYPAYSAGIVPFAWMMRDNLEKHSMELELNADLAREPELGYETNWVHEAGNQTALLNGFSAHLRKEESLCLFYAKHVPFVEGTGRILIGVGRIKEIGTLSEYKRKGEGVPGMIWERPIQHSIRAKGKDGFLMPYQDLLTHAKADPALDIEQYVANAPPEHWNEFSYGSELVTHDGAISALLSMDKALERQQKDLGITTDWKRQWLHDELVRLWKVRGPFPGLGAVLHAFGLSRGIFVAHALQEAAGENVDPWPLVDKAFRTAGGDLPKELRKDFKELKAAWTGLPELRRRVLRLLSRFELTVDQAAVLYDENTRAKAKWKISDREIIENPYSIYECGRHDPEGVRLTMIDRGVFPEDAVRLVHPLEAPSGLESALDGRRIRAFAIQVLEDAAAQGHTLYFPGELADAIKNQVVSPPCSATSDIVMGSIPMLAPHIVPVTMGAGAALQLARYCAIRELLVKQVLGRVNGQRHSVVKDWHKLVLQKFKPTKDAEELRARAEKASALAELADSRFSVLAGPAGAGKTTVLGILCAQEEVVRDGLLLLAPTGKARVRMQQLAGGAGERAQTIAQFLNKNGRYDGRAGRYHMSDRPKVTGFGTVIVDEASMLTEDMLGALLDALQGVKRLILVGDPAQLPPIGAGRPFVDIIAKLRPADHEAKFPRVAPGYVELTIERRQIGTERPDLRLARWFSATTPSAGEDDVFSGNDDVGPTLRFARWDSAEEFQDKLLSVLVEELKLTDADDRRGFNRALGATEVGEYDYFNRSGGAKPGAVQQVEAWQILSPLRGMPFGVSDINRQIHERFRAGYLEFASRQWRRSIPKPLGVERVVYGDKVINLANHRRDGWKVFPEKDALGYLANGEVGIAVGQWKTNGNPKILNVEFSSQPGFTYGFLGGDFREEGDAALELAYALTVHKSQGSQFGLVILVVPEGHPLVSRELIYTALTRHQDRVVVLHQGSRSLLRDFSAPHKSETARRRTNLMADCSMLEFPQAKGSVFLQEGLIHRTSKGLAVRSKSELLIAEALMSAGVSFEYEKPLTFGVSTRYPDFTLENEISGRTVIWEHLGMLDRQDYRLSWERKLNWYRANGVLPLAEAKADSPILVTTADSAAQGLDMGLVKKIIAEVCAG